MSQPIRRTYAYRIYPTKAQEAALEKQLREACALYNAALQHRRDAWREHGQRISAYTQALDLKHMRAEGVMDPGVNHQSQREPLYRLDKAFDSFFRRLRAGETPGYPRFKSASRFDSLRWVYGNGCRVRDGKLTLQAVGAIRVRWHRELPPDAEVRELRVKRSAGRWYVYFALRAAQRVLPATGCEVGIDLGITTFAATSNGELLVGPRAYRKAQAELRIAQRRVARRQRGSHRRRKAVQQLARKHERIRRIRADHAHKLAAGLVNDHDLIAVEDLNVRGLARMRLAKDVHDQGWTQFVSFLQGKAESAGREVVLVDPRNTSQTCSACGVLVPKPLSERVHRCACGYEADRDVNAARNVLARAQGHCAQTRTVEEVAHAVV